MFEFFCNYLIPETINTQIYPAFENSVDPDQLASKKPTDLELHCLQFSTFMWIYINNQD